MSGMRDRIAMHNGNRLKLGLFGANCSNGRAMTRAPERWPADWDSCERLAEMADAAGIDFMLPIGRWKGYRGETDHQGATLESITWACGLLARTKRMTVFATVHVPLLNPVMAAKQMVTADLVGHGRFGLNIVVGWNDDEFQMFGIEQREPAGALRIRPGVDRRGQAHVGPGGGVRLRRQVPEAAERAHEAEAPRRHAAADHERRRLADRARLRTEELRRAVHRGALSVAGARGARGGRR